jgi:hypothetical protein
MLNNQSGYDFNARVVKLGITTLSAGIIANFIPVLYVWLAYGIIPPLADIMKIWVVAAIAFGASWTVQLPSYFPVLGMSGTYVSFLVGSVAEIRLPASAMAQKVTGVEQGTRESEVISTIAIAGSVLVSAFIITLFTFIGAAVIPLLPKFIQKSFNYILPAVFAAVFLEFSSRYLKVGLVTLAFAVIFTFVGTTIKIPGWLWSPCIIVVGVMIARFFYNLERKRG